MAAGMGRGRSIGAIAIVGALGVASVLALRPDTAPSDVGTGPDPLGAADVVVPLADDVADPSRATAAVSGPAVPEADVDVASPPDDAPVAVAAPSVPNASATAFPAPIPPAARVATATTPPVGSPATTPATSPPDTPSAPDPVLPEGPSLDVVRIDAGGSTVVAGSGAGGADVILRLDGEEVAAVRTDAAGNFVSLFDLGTSDVPRVLTVETRDAAGTIAQAQGGIIVAPTFPPAPAVGATPTTPPASARERPDPVDRGAPDPAVVETVRVETTPEKPAGPIDGAAVASGGGPLVRADVPDRIAASPPATDPGAADGGPDAPPVAASPPRLFRAGPGGIALIEPSPGAPRVVTGLGIDAITYDATGAVSLAGTGTTGSDLRIYLDGQPVQSSRVGQGGTWSSPLPNVDSGVYTLRIDALDTDGSVQGRVETPFQRTAPGVAAASRRDGVTAITVQPGFTLWAISEGYFGEGIQYVQIFERNRDQIRDPDLIFPGQIFDLPPGE